MVSFDENGQYIKTNWKSGDKITATRLNKIEESIEAVNYRIEESIEAVNNNDISRHVEIDARLDALEEQKEAVEERFDELEDLVADNKYEVDTAIYEVHRKMYRLEQEMNEGIEEVHNVASTVYQVKSDMDAMVAEVEADLDGLHAKDEELSEQLAHIAKTPKQFGAVGDGLADDTISIIQAISNTKPGQILKFEANKEYIITDEILCYVNNITLDFNNSTLKLKDNSQILNKSLAENKICILIKLIGNNITIKNLTLDGNSNNNYIVHNDNIYYMALSGHIGNDTHIGYTGLVTHGNNIKVENCVFKDISWSAFAPGFNATEEYNGLTVSNCEFINSGQDCLPILHYSNVLVKNNYFENFLHDGCHAYLNCNNVEITKNIFKYNSASVKSFYPGQKDSDKKFAIYTGHCDFPTNECNNIDINNNKIYGYNAVGIDYNSYNTRFENNYCDGLGIGKECLRLMAPCTTTRITNNYFVDYNINDDGLCLNLLDAGTRVVNATQKQIGCTVFIENNTFSRCSHFIRYGNLTNIFTHLDFINLTIVNNNIDINKKYAYGINTSADTIYQINHTFKNNDIDLRGTTILTGISDNLYPNKPIFPTKLSFEENILDNNINTSVEVITGVEHRTAIKGSHTLTRYINPSGRNGISYKWVNDGTVTEDATNNTFLLFATKKINCSNKLFKQNFTVRNNGSRDVEIYLTYVGTALDGGIVIPYSVTKKHIIPATETVDIVSYFNCLNKYHNTVLTGVQFNIVINGNIDLFFIDFNAKQSQIF